MQVLEKTQVYNLQGIIPAKAGDIQFISKNKY